MCGIVGVITKYKNGFTSKQVDIFNTLLYIDALRGEDSTGAFCVDNIGNVSIIKEAYPSPHTLLEKEYREFTNDAVRKGWALVGHNRKATKGDITDENAHPFWVEDKIVLVHNGTMYGNHKQHKDVEVDSHAIAHLIVEKPTLEDALGEFNAAYALVWYDVQKKALNFLRNSQRPLHYLETDTEIIYASEAEMIDFVRRRENIYPKTGTVVNQLKEMTLVSCHLQEDKTYTEEVSTVVPKVRAGVHTGTFLGSWHGYPYGSGIVAGGKWAGYDEDGIDWETGDYISQPVVVDTRLGTNDDEHSEVVVDLGEAKSKYEAGKLPTYPWTKFHTLLEFEKLKKEYEDATINVEFMDYLSVDENGDKVQMIGRTNDSNHLCVTFQVNKPLADHLTDPKAPRNLEGRPSLFNVKVDVMRWTKHNSHLGIISFACKDALLTLNGQVVH